MGVAFSAVAVLPAIALKPGKIFGGRAADGASLRLGIGEYIESHSRRIGKKVVGFPKNGNQKFVFSDLGIAGFTAHNRLFRFYSGF